MAPAATIAQPASTRSEGWGKKAVVDKMNNLIREKSFTKMVVDERFQRLQEELNELGWLGFVKTLDFKEGEMHAQLKLVDLDSEEARMSLL